MYGLIPDAGHPAARDHSLLVPGRGAQRRVKIRSDRGDAPTPANPFRGLL